jgi:hypothetical protein
LAQFLKYNILIMNKISRPLHCAECASVVAQTVIKRNLSRIKIKMSICTLGLDEKWNVAART